MGSSILKFFYIRKCPVHCSTALYHGSQLRIIWYSGFSTTNHSKKASQGSIIIADNVVRAGKVLDETSEDAAVQGVQRFNHMLSYNEDVYANILQTIGVKDWAGIDIAVVK